MIDQPKPTSHRGDHLHDEHIDALWAATRADGPSPDIDAALRAAARREIGAGPQPSRPPVAEATRWERWWWPLAAAATIGAVAIGLLQLTPNERSEPAVVSDMPAQTARKAEASAPRSPIASGGAETRVDAAPLPVAPSVAEKKRDGARESEQAERAPGPSPSAKPPERRREIDRALNPAERAQDELATRPLPVPSSSGNALTAPAASSNVPTAPAAAEAPATAATPAAPPAPVPSPADTAKDSSGAPRATSAVAAGSIVGATAQPNKAAMMQQQAAASRATSAPGSPAAGPAGTPAPLAKVAPAQSSTEPAKAAVRPAAEWIALIRRLRDENKPSEAAKELTAFRATYPDADRLLPQDLRNWHPPPAGANPQ
jgi:hypothetical protein